MLFDSWKVPYINFFAEILLACQGVFELAELPGHPDCLTGTRLNLKIRKLTQRVTV